MAMMAVVVVECGGGGGGGVLVGKGEGQDETLVMNNIWESGPSSVTHDHFYLPLTISGQPSVEVTICRQQRVTAEPHGR